ncbi:MAG: DNA repair protein RecO [Clostridia bacterium]|nr:DNA repair protein RecO [Clostridia bacterium]
MHIATEGLVLREQDIGDNDRLITILSRDLGVIRAYASGVKSIKSKRDSGTCLLSFSSFMLHKKNDHYRVNEAVCKHFFMEAGNDLFVLSIAQYFCELAELLCPKESPADTFLRLMLNSLYFLTEGKRDLFQIKAITELRICTVSGYCPDLIGCSSCGAFEKNLMYFNPNDGSLLCQDCSERNGFQLNRTVLSAMRHIIYSEFNRLYAFEIPSEDSKYLSEITERYLLYQTEHHFKTLDFFHSL